MVPPTLKAQIEGVVIDSPEDGRIAAFCMNRQDALMIVSSICISADMARSIPEKELADGREMLANLARAQKVERHLLHVQKLPVFFLKVTCDGDTQTVVSFSQTTVN